MSYPIRSGLALDLLALLVSNAEWKLQGNPGGIRGVDVTRTFERPA